MGDYPYQFWVLLTFMLLSLMSNNKSAARISITLGIFFLVKWWTDYRKCTLSYLECKLRGVKKEDGIINKTLDPIFDINSFDERWYIYGLFITLIVVLLYF